MSKLTKKQRDELPLSDFGDPDRRLFPIVDQDDVDSAAHLIGKAKNPGAVKKRIISIAKRKGLTIPDAWKAQMGRDHGGDDQAICAFGIDESGRFVEGDYAVYPNALLFEAGDYSDKGFTLTPEEQWAAVETFTPVAGNIEHTDFLQGRACEVRDIRLDDEDSHRLRGTVAVPLWLDEHLTDKERKLSCEWNRTTKTLDGIGLVVHPRVEAAALMSAFSRSVFARSRHDTSRGQQAIQELHDTATRYGAVCKAPAGSSSGGGSAKMASRHEATAIQDIHDTAVAHGATCDDGSVPRPFYFSRGRQGSTPWRGGAQSRDHGGTKGPRKTMKLSDLFRGMIGAARDEGLLDDLETDTSTFSADPPATEKKEAAQGTPAVDPKIAELEAKFAAAEKAREAEAAKVARLEAERIQSEAVAFADKQIGAHKALPAERESIITAYTQALEQDVAHGPVTFADGSTKAHVASIAALYEARPALDTLFESMVPGSTAALFNQERTPSKDRTPGAEEPLDPKRREKFLSQTAQGRAMLQKEKAAAANGKSAS